jgi:predicted permease
MNDLFQDLRLALRGLARAPGFAAVAMLSLGVGIGAVTTIYTWTDRFLLRPLPLVPSADRLVQLFTRAPEGGEWSVSYPLFRDWGERNQVFEGLAACTLERLGVRSGQGVEPAFTSLVSENYFDVLRVRALHGRTFQAGEERRAAPVAVLGHDYWIRRFSGDPAAVGQQLVVNGHGFEVVGVMPPRFGGAYMGLNLDLYLPITTLPTVLGRNPLQQRDWRFLEAFARPKPGMTLAQVRDDLGRMARDLEQTYPGGLNDAIVGPITDRGPPATLKPVFLALLGVTGMVLLIACANVANLLLARAWVRQKEFGVRLALGASRRRLVRQLLAESAVLALGGGWLGLGLAALGRDGITALVPPTPLPIGMDFPVNVRVVALAFALATVTVVVFGLGPALRASRPDLVTVLKDLRTGSRPHARARNALVAGQMALAVVSLACAGLFLRAIQRSHQLDPGFRDPASLLLADTDLRIAGLTDSAGPVVLGQVLDRLRAVPGVERVGAATFVPLGWSCCASQETEVDGYAPQDDENTAVVYSLVTADYFETMGIELVRGRSFTPSDRDGANVAVVNQAFVRRYWPGREPLGGRVRQGGADFTVIGVARDGHYRQVTDVPFPLVYRLLGQGYEASLTIHVRGRGDPRLLVETLRREARAVNADFPFLDPRLMTDQMEQSTIGQQVGSRTLAVFGALALLLSAVGIYGVMAYAVSQRTGEIGVRVALGAAQPRIVRMVVGEGLRITAIGALVGGVLAFGAGRLMEGLLLGVSPSDPLTFAGVAVLLAAVAVVACLLPARRAAGVDPVVAFRA